MKELSTKAHPAAGVTLIELLVATAVFMVIALISGPSFVGVMQKNQVWTLADKLRASINLARSEAVFRNSRVSLCPSRMSRTGVAQCAGSYKDGWIIFSDHNGDGVVDQDSDAVIRVIAESPAGYAVTNRKGDRESSEVITYHGDGTSRRNLTLQVCPPQGSSVPSRSVVLNMVGRARVQEAWGQCPVGKL